MARRFVKTAWDSSSIVTTGNGSTVDLEGAEVLELAYTVTDATPAAVSGNSGQAKVTTVSFPAKAAATDNDYVKLVDADGNSWGIALSTAGVAEVAEITCIAEGSVAEKTQIVAVAEGSVKNVTQVVATADLSGSLAGTSLKVYDKDGSVGIWISVDSVPAAAPAGAVACSRQVEVAISEDDTASDVGAAFTTAFTLDAGLVVGNVGATVTITDVAYAARTAATDAAGVEATGFAITTTAVGHASNLHTKFFVLKDEVGTVGFWFDVDNAGASAPTTGAARDVEISTLTSGMTAAQVATAVYNAIHADSKFNGVSDASGTIVVVSTTYGNKTGQSAGDSGFTVTEHTAGAASALTGKYFILRDAGGTVGVWFDIGNEGTAAPAGASGATRAIEVNTIARGATAAAVATALAAVLENDSKYAAVAADTKVTVTQSELGVRVDAADGDTGFTFSTTTQGSATGAGPTGAIWAAIAAGRKVLVDISGCTDAASVATAVESAFDALTGATTKMATTKSTGDILFTREKPAVVVDDVPKSADDSGAGSITSVESTVDKASIFNPSDDTVTIAAHGFTTGLKLALTINSGSLPTGLAATNYWAIVTNATTFKLASSYANAAAGTAVDFSDYGTADKTATFTPASLSIGVTVQKSVDNVTWTTATSEATKTGSGTTNVSYSAVAYPYMRVILSTVTSGICSLVAKIAGTTYIDA
jgi:hypothetical protein